ncbi:MAG: hypothetical protein ACUVS9_06295 [Thermaceae bacterium]
MSGKKLHGVVETHLSKKGYPLPGGEVVADFGAFKVDPLTSWPLKTRAERAAGEELDALAGCLYP